MQGQGTENYFLGVQSVLESSKIVLLPVGFDKTTTYKKGTDKGPKAIIEASRNLELYDIETKTEVYLEGIHTAEEISCETSEEMLETVYESVKNLLFQEKFIVTVGGEHSISLAPVRAHAEYFEKISVLQFDAHTDLAFAYQGNPYSHGSVMKRVKELKNVEKIISVGIRSMAKEEVHEIASENTFYAHQLDENNWMEKVIDRLTDKVYITFDLDVFDSSIMPSTGTPEPGGISWHMAAKLLKKVAEEKNVIGFDVVELCPIPEIWAPDFLSAKLIYKILSFVFKTREMTNGNLTLHEKTL